MLADCGGRSKTVPGDGVVDVEGLSVVTAGLITGGEYGTVCVIVGVADSVRIRVRAF
jgi:hypothetical protein